MWVGAFLARVAKTRQGIEFANLWKISLGTWTSPSIARSSVVPPPSPSRRSGWSYGPGCSRERWGTRCNAVRPTARYSHRRAVCSVTVSTIRRTRRARRKEIRASLRQTSGGTCQSRRAPRLSFESVLRRTRADVTLLSLSLSLPPSPSVSLVTRPRLSAERCWAWSAVRHYWRIPKSE